MTLKNILSPHTIAETCNRKRKGKRLSPYEKVEEDPSKMDKNCCRTKYTYIVLRTERKSSTNSRRIKEYPNFVSRKTWNMNTTFPLAKFSWDTGNFFFHFSDVKFFITQGYLLKLNFWKVEFLRRFCFSQFSISRKWQLHFYVLC